MQKYLTLFSINFYTFVINLVLNNLNFSDIDSRPRTGNTDGEEVDIYLSGHGITS